MPVEFQPTPAQNNQPEFKSGLFEVSSTRKEFQLVLQVQIKVVQIKSHLHSQPFTLKYIAFHLNFTRSHAENLGKNQELEKIEF